MPEFIHVNSEDALKKLNSNSKDKLVKYYMDGCGHCDDLEPIWKLVEKRIKKDHSDINIVVVQLNANYMENADLPNVEGFPTISMIKGGKKIEHKGARTEEAIIDFFKKNSLNTMQTGGGKRHRKTKKQNRKGKRKNKKKTKRKHKRSKKGKGPVMSKAKSILPAKKVKPHSAVTGSVKISDDNYEIARLNRRGNELANEIRNPRSPWSLAAAEEEFKQNKRIYERMYRDVPVAEKVEEDPKIVGRKKQTSVYDGSTKSGFTVQHGRRVNRVVPISGGKRKKNKSNKKKPRKWSRKYKKSINCKRPKGFSQKQYCKYGRKKKGGRSDPGYSTMSEQELLELIANQNNPNNLDTLKDIVQAKNTFDTTGQEIVGTTKTGFMALKKINKILNELLDRHAYTNEEWTDEINEDHAKYAWFQDQADAIISDSSPEDPIEGVVYYNTEGEPLYGLDFHEQFQI